MKQQQSSLRVYFILRYMLLFFNNILIAQNSPLSPSLVCYFKAGSHNYSAPIFNIDCKESWRKDLRDNTSHLLSAPLLINYTLEDFKQRAIHKKLSNQEQLKEYELYRYTTYRTYLKTLPEYAEHILYLHKYLQTYYTNKLQRFAGIISGNYAKGLATIVAQEYNQLVQLQREQITPPHSQQNQSIFTTTGLPVATDFVEPIINKYALIKEDQRNPPSEDEFCVNSDTILSPSFSFISSDSLSVQQHCLQQEFKQITNAYTYSILPTTHYNQVFKEGMVVGIQAIRCNQTTIAAQMVKFCKGLLTFVPAIVQGIEEAIVDTATGLYNTVAHPLQSLNAAIHSIIGLTSIAGRLVKSTATLTLYALTDHDKFVARIDDIEQFVSTVCKQAADYCKNTPPELLVKNVTYCATSLLLTKGINRCISLATTLLNQDAQKIITIFKQQSRPSTCLMLHDTNVIKKKQRNIKTFKNAKVEQSVVNNCLDISVKALKVNNIKELFVLNDFGRLLGKHAVKTGRNFQGQPIYKLIIDIKEYDLYAGTLFYLDQLHKNHLEVFNKNGTFKAIFNLDGSINFAKAKRANGNNIKSIMK